MMKTTDSGSGKLLRNLLFFSTLLLALLISVWARAEQVTLAWDANTEPDLAGYKIHYGAASGSYSVHMDVHNVTTYTVTGLTAGQTYYFAATAYNASGNESGHSNQVSYAVPSPNGAPATPATPTGSSSALVNTAVAFSTTATDPNGDSLQYRFDWGGGVLSSWGAASQSRTWTAAGQYAVKAQARDSLGAESGWSGARTVTITQSVQNAAPTTPATPTGSSSAPVNTALTFSTTATDPNGDSLQYRFDWGGGVLSSWGAASQSRGWAAAGQYAVKAQARDSLGAESGWSGARTVTITQSVQNAAPTTPATPTGLSSALVNTALTFSTTATDPNGDSLQYRFDWGGGVLSSWGAASQSRGWAAAGQYAVRAQARDSLGAESGWSGARTVTITSPAPVVVDTDGDGVPDSQDAFPSNPAEWADANGNGIGDNADAAQNHPPAAPQVLAPAASALTPLAPTLQTGAFSDPDAGDAHSRTRWQIVQASNSLVVLDVTSSAELTALQVPSLLLDENTVYHCRAMFYDNHGAASEWSPQVRFATDFSLTDSNGNGIPDSQEVDPATDPDGSGVSGTQDVRVKTVRTGKSGAKVGIGTAPSSGAAIYSIESTDPDVLEIDVDADGISDALPFGLLNFKLVLDQPGDQAVLTVYFSEPMPKRGRWYKYDPIQKRWSDFSRYAQFSDDRMSMTLTITDGGEGDADGVANGIILDPAGVLVASSSGSDSIIDGVVGGVGSVVDSAQGGCFIAASGPGRSTGGESFNGRSAIFMLTLAGLWFRKAFQTGFLETMLDARCGKL
jgi:hypothetical protein